MCEKNKYLSDNIREIEYIVAFLLYTMKNMKECDCMSTATMTTEEKVAYATRVLKQYKSNAYLANLDFQPILNMDGTISNLASFIEVKNNTRDPFSCDTPVERFSSLAPRAITAILEGINHMDSSFEEKQSLFAYYVENDEKASEPTETAYVSFAEAYDDTYVKPPVSKQN